MNIEELGRLLAAHPQLDASQIVTSLLLALVLGVAVALTYRFSVPERVLSSTMLSSLILLAMIGAMSTWWTWVGTERGAFGFAVTRANGIRKRISSN